jgi:hypothetical protein
MHLIEQIRVSEEGAEAGVCTQVNRPPFVFDFGKVCRIRSAEYSPTEADKLLIPFVSGGVFRHMHAGPSIIHDLTG